jgi:RNA polymerase sigma-70 factor (ECF subfamily)
MMESNPLAARFPTTCWSRIVAAGSPVTPKARAALAELCAAYWYPLYAFIRRKGHGPDEAVDLTQGYFARLLERGTVAAAAAGNGRFWSFLRTDCARFERERALTLLEGGLAIVRQEYETSGRGATLRILKGVLEAGSSPISQAEMAALLGTS